MNEKLQAVINEHSLLLDSAALSTGLCVFFALLAIYMLNRLVQEDDRTYMDPLPFGLKLVWPDRKSVV